MRIWHPILAALFGVIIGLSNACASSPDLLIESVLNDPRYKVRLQAARSLAAYPGNRTLRALARALGDNHALVRAAASHTLGQLADARAVPDLCRMQQDDDDFVRRTVRRSLNIFGGPKACASYRVLVAFDVSGDRLLQGAVLAQLAQAAKRDERIVVSGEAGAETLMARVQTGSMPGVQMRLHMSHKVHRDANGIRIKCTLAQSIYDLRQQSLRGSATQHAEIEVGKQATERALQVQTQGCFDALVPVAYDGLKDYVARLK